MYVFFSLLSLASTLVGMKGRTNRQMAALCLSFFFFCSFCFAAWNVP